MTQHSTAFEIERPVPAGAVKELLPGAYRQCRRARGAARRRQKIQFSQAVDGGCGSWPCWPARPGMAGTTGPSASIWSRPTTPM